MALSRKERDARYRKKHPNRRRDLAMLYKYGIGLAEYDELLEAQEYTCALCKREKKLHIDHNHATGAVRGLLCHGCNTALGLMEEDPTVLRRAITYLKEET